MILNASVERNDFQGFILPPEGYIYVCNVCVVVLDDKSVQKCRGRLVYSFSCSNAPYIYGQSGIYYGIIGRWYKANL